MFKIVLCSRYLKLQNLQASTAASENPDTVSARTSEKVNTADTSRKGSDFFKNETGRVSWAPDQFFKIWHTCIPVEKTQTGAYPIRILLSVYPALWWYETWRFFHKCRAQCCLPDSRKNSWGLGIRQLSKQRLNKPLFSHIAGVSRRWHFAGSITIHSTKITSSEMWFSPLVAFEMPVREKMCKLTIRVLRKIRIVPNFVHEMGMHFTWKRKQMLCSEIDYWGMKTSNDGETCTPSLGILVLCRCVQKEARVSGLKCWCSKAVSNPADLETFLSPSPQKKTRQNCQRSVWCNNPLEVGKNNKLQATTNKIAKYISAESHPHLII